MKTMFSNATMMWNEKEINEKEYLIKKIYMIVSGAWKDLNKSINFSRVETPILTTKLALKSHSGAGFKMLETSRGVLRPETTAGSILAFQEMFPIKAQRQKVMPWCIWQAGKSFRDGERCETMQAYKLRLIEFYQMEFQLFCGKGTKADYLTAALNQLIYRFGGEIIVSNELPHYSYKTLDWKINGLEIAGCSIRNDFADGMLFEVSIGLDRLLTKVLKL